MAVTGELRLARQWGSVFTVVHSCQVDHAYDNFLSGLPAESNGTSSTLLSGAGVNRILSLLPALLAMSLPWLASGGGSNEIFATNGASLFCARQ